MKILLLGGSKFLGLHTVQAALANGHEVTLFNRGSAGREAFGDRVEYLRGDRDPRDPSGKGGLTALENDRTWDVVLDTSGYLPRVVEASSDLLKERCSCYLFISSISVYQTPIVTGADEEAPVAVMEDPANEEVMAHYGALKALCEQRVRASFGEEALVVRPGLIVGPNDPTDRFSYWPFAAAAADEQIGGSGRLLCPGAPDMRTRVLDVRDLSTWLIHLIENKVRGTFNASGPRDTFTMGELIEACLNGVGSQAKPVWIPQEFLEDQGASPWSDLPCWIPPNHEVANNFTASVERAEATGLKFRPLAETARDTWDWLQLDLPKRDQQALRAGLAPKRSNEILDAWTDAAPGN